MEILLVDDDQEVVRAYARVARAHEHRVQPIGDGHEALRILETKKFDLVVLDVNMPRLSGLDVCRTMRARGDVTPVLILTAQSSDEAEIEALEAGADDFVSKPCGPGVFEARLKALQRRASLVPPRKRALGKAIFDEDRRTVTMTSDDGGRDRVIALSQMEARVLGLLATQPSRHVSRETLLETCWDEDAKVSDNALAAVAARLRHRLAGTGLSIRAARGRGLSLLVDEPAAPRGSSS